jgi:hypothetical protein
MSLSEDNGLGPNPGVYAPLGQPGEIPADELVPEGTLEDDPLRGGVEGDANDERTSE